MTFAPAKGSILSLLHTVKARQRVIAALSWDPRADKASFMDRLRGNDQQHDLDISCFVYNANGDYIDFVGPMAQDSMDQTGAIYHSGDDATGEGGGDDEFISAELAGLPEDTAHLIFLVEIRSNHSFSAVDAPLFRLADGMTNNTLMEIPLAEEGGGKDASACVLVRLFRDFDSETGWSVQWIEEYPSLAEINDWGDYLTRYL